MLVAGQSMGARPQEAPRTKIAKPGGFFPRLIALVIDNMILIVLFIPLYALWVSQLSPLAFTPGANIEGEITQRKLSLQAAYLVIYIFYFAGSWTMLGATPGQLLMSLRVTDVKAGGIGFFKALIRALFLAPVFWPISVLLLLVSKQKRSFHDLLAGTYVIQIVDADQAGASPTDLPGTKGAVAAATAAAAPAPAPAPAPVPVPAPAPAPAPYTPEPQATDFAPAPIGAAGAYPAPPLTASAQTEAYAPSADTYSPAPMTAAPDPHAYTPAPLPPTGEPDAAPDNGSSPGADEGLYAPPPMSDSGLYTDPAPAPAEREVYTPTPGQISERAVKSAELFAGGPEVGPSEAGGSAAPAEHAGPTAGEPEAAASAEPAPHTPIDGGELPPIEFPPMAAPPEEHK
jgi:uncharacterized RDD family membrane protein YckC